MKKLRQRVAVKSITGIVLLLLVFSVIISVIGNRGFTEALLNQYSDNAFHTARIAAVVVDADRIGEYWASGGETEEYHAVWESLTRLCNSSGATFVYVIEPDRTDWAHIRFLFSTINRNSHYSVYDFGYLRETTNDEYREKYRALYEGTATQELVIRDKGYIETDSHITAMIPLKNSAGEVLGILCVQQQLDTLLRVRDTYLRRVVIAFISLTLLVVVGQSLYLHRALLRPLKLISEEATRFSEENVTTGRKLQETIRNADEIGQLAASIDRMEEQIQRNVENLTRITAEKERISTELSLATRIQAAMLPHIFPPFPERTEFDLYASMDPAKEVGGDFYDFFLVDDDHLCMVMADVSGKGVPAALFMMVSKIILQSVAMLGRSPAEILTKTNEAICSNNETQMFVTVWLGILEISTGKLTAANAGHEYPVLKKPDGRFELFKDKHGLVIGAMDGVRYRQYELQLEPGAKLFLYTDGVPEATDAENTLFGTERMLEALNADPDAGPTQLLKNVRVAVDGFAKDADQFDDLTMLCMEYRGLGHMKPKEYELELPAEVERLDEVLSFIERHLEENGCPPKAQMQIAVSAEEIFVNIAQYAYAPGTGTATVQMELSEEPAAVTLRFIDGGMPFDPLSKSDPDVTLAAEDRQIGGLGIYMTKKVMDDARYEYRDGKNRLTLIKRF